MGLPSSSDGVQVCFFIFLFYKYNVYTILYSIYILLAAGFAGYAYPAYPQAWPWMRASGAAALAPQLGRAPPQVCKHQVYRPAGILVFGFGPERCWPAVLGLLATGVREKDQERKS